MKNEKGLWKRNPFSFYKRLWEDRYIIKKVESVRRNVVVGFFFFLCSINLCGQEKKLKLYSEEELQHDFHQMVELMQQHPALYSFTPENEMGDFIQKQYSKINRAMTVAEFFTICAPIIEKIRCSHTWLTLPTHFLDSNNVSIFPLHGMMLNDSLIVTVPSDSALQLVKGTAILEINGTPFIEILKYFKTLIPSDGYSATGKNAAINYNFNIYISICLGFTDKYIIIYQKPKEGIVKSIEVNAAKFNSFRYPKPVKKATCDSLLCFEVVKEKQTAIVGIHSFVYYNDTVRFNRFIDSCFGIVHTQHIPNMILDLRGNGGGDPFCASYLLAYLAQKPFVYYAESYQWYPTLSTPIAPNHKGFKGKLFVLIDGGCISSTGHLIALMKFNRIGTLIGEETGGTFTCNANTKWYELDKTRLKVLMARKTFQVAASGFLKDRGIFPDHQVYTDIKNYVADKDMMLDYTFDLLQQK